MTPLVFGLGVWELLIILAVILLIFGGTRLAGLGKSTGRALREFKEETRGLSDSKEAQALIRRLPQSSGPSRERRGPGTPTLRRLPPTCRTRVRRTLPRASRGQTPDQSRPRTWLSLFRSRAGRSASA